MQNLKFNSLVQKPVVKLPQVIQVSGKSRSGIYADIKNGTFPKPIHIGKRAVAWLVSDINQWIEDQIILSKGKNHD
jgi:prophage regulatory protein